MNAAHDVHIFDIGPGFGAHDEFAVFDQHAFVGNG
jgi:hypothetical protein